MREQVMLVVERYIEAVRNNDASAPSPPSGCRLLVSHQHVSRRYVLSARAGSVRQDRKAHRRDPFVVDGEHCVAILNIETVFGPIPFAEYIHVVNGQIVAIRGYCDPRPMLGAATPAAE